jgi:tRNA (guanine37-N1)-methyltransferase
MTFHIITIFPKIFSSYFNESIIKRALDAGKIKIKIYDLRDWTTDKHRTVDDTPYGGGAGMVMKVEPLYKALKAINFKFPNPNFSPSAKALGDRQAISNDSISKEPVFNFPNRVILTSAKGRKWSQQKAEEYKKLDNLVIICGRYEGVDERILNFVDEEISIGDYVLTGGEIPAMVMVDSISRLIPGVLGNAESLKEESHSIKFKDQKIETSHQALESNTGSEIENLEYPQYTRPEVFIDDNGNEYKVPEILLSGNHAAIEKWRRDQTKHEA